MENNHWTQQNIWTATTNPINAPSIAHLKQKGSIELNWTSDKRKKNAPSQRMLCSKSQKRMTSRSKQNHNWARDEAHTHTRRHTLKRIRAGWRRHGRANVLASILPNTVEHRALASFPVAVFLVPFLQCGGRPCMCENVLYAQATTTLCMSYFCNVCIHQISERSEVAK